MCDVINLNEYRDQRLPVPTVGGWLKSQRLSQKVSQEELAERIGVPIARIEAFENGNPDKWLADAISYHLDQMQEQAMCDEWRQRSKP